MKKTEAGASSSNDWKKLVSAMRESNRNCYEDVLGQVMSFESTGSAAAASTTVTAVDPSQFYEGLSSYTLKHEVTAINTQEVADSATVFRSLLQAVEFSVKRELERVQSLCEVLEVEQWNEGGEMKESYHRMDQLKIALENVRDAMKVEWSGMLMSQIVGTCETEQSVEVQSESRAITTATVIKRTKKNGGIERPIPVPFPLPVVKQNPNLQQSLVDNEPLQSNQNERLCFDSLVSSLHSVTIEPNPIRGYDWRGLIKRGEVKEEILVHKKDSYGNIIESSEVGQGQDMRSGEKTMHLDGMSVVHAQEKKKNADDASVASRSVGIQATDSSQMKGDKILIPKRFNDSVEAISKAGETEEISKADKVLNGNVSASSSSNDEASETGSANILRDDNAHEPPPPPPSFEQSETDKKHEATPHPPPPLPEEPVDSNLKQTPKQRDVSSIYAAAAAAIAANTPRRRFLLRKSLDRQEPLRLSGMTVGDPSRSITISPMPTFEGNSSGLDAESDDNSNSVETSTVDSKVSSLDDDQSSMTHSSAIETPSDIDDLSLGSFTESEEDTSKKDDVVPEIPELTPNESANDNQATTSNMFEPTTKSITTSSEHLTQSNITPSTASASTEIVDSNDSSTESSNEDSSSTSSYTSSSTDSSSESSSSSDEHISNNVPQHATNDQNKANTSSGDAKQDWVTRKETRFCFPLPQNLIFHLKRGHYCPSLGRVETINSEVDIPEELDVKSSCLNVPDMCNMNTCCYKYCLTGAVVHVDHINDSDEVYGEAKEGHYVTFINKADIVNNKLLDARNHWFEMDDDKVHLINEDNCVVSSNRPLSQTERALKVLSGCEVISSNRIETEERHATIVVYSRGCGCHARK